MKKIDRAARKVTKIEDVIHNFFSTIGIPKPYIEAAISGDLQFVLSNINYTERWVVEYLININNHQGLDSLHRPIEVIVGTIDSVQGESADVVYLSPDLSRDMMAQWATHGAPRNRIRRLFYAAMTRARKELVVCNASTHNSVTGLI